jgi:transcriptional regulator with XRE-family HTH domain
MPSRNDAASPAALLGVGPAMNVTDIHASHERGGLRATTLSNDIEGCVVHARHVAIIATYKQAQNAIIAPVLCCELRNTAPMIADWIREGLKRPGKSQTGLAAALGRDKSAVSNIVKGKRQVKAHEIPLIADYLGLPPPVGYGASVERTIDAPEGGHDREQIDQEASSLFSSAPAEVQEAVLTLLRFAVGESPAKRRNSTKKPRA